MSHTGFHYCLPTPTRKTLSKQENFPLKINKKLMTPYQTIMRYHLIINTNN